MKAKRKEIKRVNLKLDEEVHTKAKIIAVLRGITLNDYIERALLKEIENDRELLDKIKKL